MASFAAPKSKAQNRFIPASATHKNRRRKNHHADPSLFDHRRCNPGAITEGAFTEASVGNIYQEGHENEILTQAFGHRLKMPTDVQSGQPTGQRRHQPLSITKVFDKSSPLLYTALATGERLTKCQLKFYRTSVSGTQEHYFTIELEDAIITDINAYMHNCQDPGCAHYTHLEDVAFSYRKITWSHEAAGTSGADDWRSPQKAEQVIGTRKPKNTICFLPTTSTYSRFFHVGSSRSVCKNYNSTFLEDVLWGSHLNHLLSIKIKTILPNS